MLPSHFEPRRDFAFDTCALRRYALPRVEFVRIAFTKETPLAARQSVLVVDPLEETHEVLRTALGDQGIEVVAARSSAHGLSLARRRDVSLIVYDLESDGVSGVLAGKLLLESAARRTPLLVLGNARRSAAGLTGCQTLPKPYHYSALIRRIEELLGEAVKGARRGDAQAA